MQKRLSDIPSVDELRNRVIQVWCNVDHVIIDTNGVKDLEHVFV